MSYTRFAIYYVPPKGALADFGAGWLGWDSAAGRTVKALAINGLDDVTVTPRKYGFHGTLKPPFRLANGCDPSGLQAAVAALAGQTASAACDGLQLSRIGRFLALTPVGDTSELARVARSCVEVLDEFRAPPMQTELDRRRQASLTARQEALLKRWGYPYVAEEFRFHLTLTGALAGDALDHWYERAQAHLPDLPEPFEIDAITLCGEAEDGRFHVIHRYALTG